MTNTEILQAEKKADQWAYDEIVSLRKQRDELLAAIDSALLYLTSTTHNERKSYRILSRASQRVRDAL